MHGASYWDVQRVESARLCHHSKDACMQASASGLPARGMCRNLKCMQKLTHRVAAMSSCMCGAEADCSSLAGERKWGPQKETLARGTDMVIGTPGRVLSHVQAGTLDLRACQTVVMDEVDVLLGTQHAFAEQVGACRTAPAAWCIVASRVQRSGQDPSTCPAAVMGELDVLPGVQ